MNIFMYCTILLIEFEINEYIFYAISVALVIFPSLSLALILFPNTYSCLTEMDVKWFIRNIFLWSEIIYHVSMSNLYVSVMALLGWFVREPSWRLAILFAIARRIVCGNVDCQRPLLNTHNPPTYRRHYKFIWMSVELKPTARLFLAAMFSIYKYIVVA